MNQHSLKILDFDLVRQALARRCGTPYAREQALGLVPSFQEDQVCRQQELTSEARDLAEAGVGFEYSALGDMRPALEALRQGAILEPSDLMNLGRHLRLARLIRTGLELRQDRCPRLWEIAQSLVPDRSLEGDIERSFEPDGSVSDRASTQLQRIRREKETARDRVLRELEEIMAGSGPALQEPLVTIRQGRYVLPVKAEARSKFKGIVHDTSASGATSFIEPLATVDLNNRLRQLEIEEQHEIERILRSFSVRVLAAAEGLGNNIETIATLDLVAARAQLSLDWKSTRPVLSKGGSLKLVKARHPAIEEPVPLDIELGDGRQAMVITGPNTGGKTVALKTVGLMALMHQSGLFLPAEEGTALPIFDGVFADIGDEQSIAQSLSTFSSHLSHIVEILEQATSCSLVLLDELGVGTEPGEGAALAMAVLEELEGRGCMVLATTHYAALKAFAQERPGMVNAAMQFDRERLCPTFRLEIGLPGASFGLEMAQRIGLMPQIVARARERLEAKAVSLENLISHVERIKQDLEQQRLLAQEQVQRAQELSQDYQKKLDLWKEKERELLQEARQRIEGILSQARRASEQAVALVRAEQASKESIKKARQMIAQVSEEAAALAEPLEAATDSQKIELSLGQEVFLPMANGQAIVVSLPDASGRLKVQMGSVRMTVRRDQVQALGPRPGPGTEGRDAGRETTVGYEPLSSFPPELHLLGMRADEALEKLDRYLDEAVFLGVGRVRIVHGKGTGALRQAVKEALSRDSRIKSFRLGQWDEGQDGVTVAELK